MWALRIIVCEPFSDPGACQRPGFKCIKINAFVLQRPPKPFDHPVVYPTTFAVHRYLHVRIRHKAGDPAEGVAAYLHTDQLGSVRMVTDDDPDADGSMVARETTYRPFGEAVEFAVSLTPPETKGFIGERFDADAGLQYLNERYYDPRLGMFIQPDWFEVTNNLLRTHN